MKRRAFTRLLTLGAGSLGLLQGEALAADELSRKEPGADTTPPLREPVTVEDFRALAQARLPKATYEYIVTGSADEITLQVEELTLKGLVAAGRGVGGLQLG